MGLFLRGVGSRQKRALLMKMHVNFVIVFVADNEDLIDYTKELVTS